MVELQFSDYELLYKILLSLVLGLIIGAEREFKAKEAIFAGIRTFPLLALLGTISSFIYEKYWEGALYISFSAIALLVIINFYLEYKKDVGITTEVSVLITFIIGILVYFNHFYLALFITFITATLLALKKQLEEFAKSLIFEDIVAVLKFFLLTAVIYPILPDKHFGPYDAFNLKEIWKMVIIVSAIDFIGYILYRIKLKNSIWLSGAIGGLISSTAVSYNLAKLSFKSPSLTNSAFLGIVIAWIILNFRVLFLIGLINVNSLPLFLVPFLIISIPQIILFIISYKKEEQQDIEKEETEIKNPFEISSALQFGFIYAVVKFFVIFLNTEYQTKGIFFASLISGLIDVDAITLSFMNLSIQNLISVKIALTGILISILSNSLFKYFYILIFANSKLKKESLKLVIITLASILLGILYIYFIQ